MNGKSPIQAWSSTSPRGWLSSARTSCDRFLADGRSVVAIDNLVTGDRTNLRSAEHRERFTFVAGRLRRSVGPVDRGARTGSAPAAADLTLRFARRARRTMAEIRSARSPSTPSGRCTPAPSATRWRRAHLPRVNVGMLRRSARAPANRDLLGNVNPVGIAPAYDEAKRFAEAYLG